MGQLAQLIYSGAACLCMPSAFGCAVHQSDASLHLGMVSKGHCCVIELNLKITAITFGKFGSMLDAYNMQMY